MRRLRALFIRSAIASYLPFIYHQIFSTWRLLRHTCPARVRQGRRKQGFWKVFQEFDKDGSGAVDNDEMKAMVESLGMIVSDKELAAMVKDADEDSSGEIEFPEFVAVIQKAAAAGVAARAASRSRR